MITHLEPDILECEVKWALRSITTNKASGGDEISTKLFQILKDDAVKVLKVWKCELQDVQAGFSKGRGTRDQIANILWIIENRRQ